MRLVLAIEGLEVGFGATRILRGVSLSVEAGQTIGIVGESGCGKSMTGLAIMGMLPPAAKIYGGSIRLDGRELLGLPEREWNRLRGQELAMVLQDPFTSLNPMMRVGAQITEVLTLHKNLSKAAAWERAIELLGHVGVPSPAESARKYPHQLSGGQRQRVVIAIAFACRPKVLIADEPTTALDVTLQAQILRLIQELQREIGLAVLLITHDIGVIAAVSDRVAVFYAGRVVEEGPAEQVLRHPGHPYTLALLQAVPDPGRPRLDAIGGQPPRFDQLPEGCSFQPRCRFRVENCRQDPPLLPVDPTHGAACWLANEVRVNASEP